MPKKKAFKKDWSKVNDKIKNRKNKFTKDERLFELTYNDKNQAKVTMRFLDSPTTDLPYVEVLNHFFKDAGGWYVKNCPTTIHGTGNGICPCCDDLYANDYYNTDNDLYYERKKNINYYVNALIVEDKNCRENEGKVFIFKFGVNIMDKIDDLLEEDRVPWDDNCGVNFIYSAKRNGKQTSYDASRFSDVETALEEYGDEEKINGDRHDLSELIADDKFEDYDALKKHYEKVIGEAIAGSGSGSSSKKRKPKTEEDEIIEEDIEEDIEDEDFDDDDMFSDDDDDEFFDELEDDEDDDDE